MLQTFVIPRGSKPLGLRSTINGIVLLHHRESQATDPPQVFGPASGSNLTVVLSEGYVQPPMQPVFDPPMPAARPNDLPGVGWKTAGYISLLSRRSSAYRPVFSLPVWIFLPIWIGLCFEPLCLDLEAGMFISSRADSGRCGAWRSGPLSRLNQSAAPALGPAEATL